MFICDDESGATLSAVLDGHAVIVTASHADSRQLVALELSAATIRGMIEELAAMADELDTEQLAAETAEADRKAAEENCWYEWRTTAGHLTSCAEPRYHELPHRDALGNCPEPRPAKQDDRCGVCHRDAHRPGLHFGNHGHDYQAPVTR